MSTAAWLWARIVLGTGFSLVLLLALAPARPAPRLSAPSALAVGACGGLVLFVVVARRCPQLPVVTRSLGILLARLGFLGLWAANEEVVWRRVALGELLPQGALPALAASTVGFALMHCTRWRLHLGTGGLFGALYLSTGALGASIAAHWTFNALVGGAVDRARRPP